MTSATSNTLEPLLSRSEGREIMGSFLKDNPQGEFQFPFMHGMVQVNDYGTYTVRGDFGSFEYILNPDDSIQGRSQGSPDLMIDAVWKAMRHGNG
jgi:hypothetical protein